ncbi:fibroblast growth factor 21-like isoform X2 [Ascaphus truei]|uniref:fibroblast growth factor 21-like isoform X2 n=1 Tax=Ascaphus truei TaxID=8439 RepID=UPI003F59C804
MERESLLEIKAVKPRILVMRGKTSTRYLCMDSSRHLYGSETYKENDCNFREVLLEDGYNVYYSEKHNSPLTLTPTRLGKPTGKEMSRFLPRDSRGESRIPMEFTADPCDLQGRNLNVESDDPLGVKDQSNILTPCLDS